MANKKNSREIRRIMRESVEQQTRDRIAGKMIAPYNMDNLRADLRVNGIGFPSGHIAMSSWAQEHGLLRLGKKLAREGHWMK